jgi:hypothetical protein
LSPNILNTYSKNLTNKATEGFGDFKIGGQVIFTVKYADELVLLAEEETVLPDITGTYKIKLEDATEWKEMWTELG